MRLESKTNKTMKYQFRPYATMQPTVVALTGKVYEKGEHPLYTEHKIIEVIDEQGEVHYAFEDELKSDEVEKQQKVYSEEEVYDLIHKRDIFWTRYKNTYSQDYISTKEWFEQFKKK